MSAGEWTEVRPAWCWGCEASLEATVASTVSLELGALLVAGNPSNPPGGLRWPGGHDG